MTDVSNPFYTIFPNRSRVIHRMLKKHLYLGALRV